MVVLKKRAQDRAQLLKKYWKQGSRYHSGAENFISKISRSFEEILNFYLEILNFKF